MSKIDQPCGECGCSEAECMARTDSCCDLCGISAMFTHAPDYALKAENDRLRAVAAGRDGDHCLCGCAFDEPTLEAIKRAEVAEAEVERLTRECLDREATETDARERLRQVEERLAAVEALHIKSSDGLRCLGCLFIWPCPTISELR